MAAHVAIYLERIRQSQLIRSQRRTSVDDSDYDADTIGTGITTRAHESGLQFPPQRPTRLSSAAQTPDSDEYVPQRRKRSVTFIEESGESDQPASRLNSRN
eukprot:355672_1